MPKEKRVRTTPKGKRCGKEPALTPAERVAAGAGMIFAALVAIAFLIFFAGGLAGCSSYRGGRVVDGSNLEIGMTIPGTEWSINFLSYTGGAKVCGNDGTSIFVTNTITESNSYFGVVRMQRVSALTAGVTPVEQGAATIDDSTKRR